MTARLGINLLWLVPGQVGGTEGWTMGLLEAIAADPPHGIDPVVFAPAPVRAAHPFLDAFEVVRAPAGASRSRRVATEASWLATAARRARVDAVHHPGGTLPLVWSAPSILTVHDLQPLAFPQYFSPVKRRYLHARLGPSIRAAGLVTAVSPFTARDISERFAMALDSIAVTPPAVDPSPPNLGMTEDGLRAAHDLDGPWFLYPAITYPHKDHDTLLRAFARVVAHHPGALLVLTGGSASMEAPLAATAGTLGIAGRVRRLGRVPAEHLDGLYRHASALVFPSRFEGVGLPVLEAMARGCPVVAARATGLVDAVGEAGLLAEPGDVDAFAAAMASLLPGGGADRSALVAAGREQVARYAPDRSAAALVAAWRRGLGIGQPR